MQLPTTISKNDGKVKELGRGLKLLICFLGLQTSYILWGISQERIMTKDYSFGRFNSSAFCVFGNRFFALFISMALVVYLRVYTTKQKPLNAAPSYYFIPSSLSNCISSWAQYEALKYLSFPTQTLSKSCKVIPVMLMGVLLNGKTYSLIEYVEAIMIALGVTTFNLTVKTSDNNHSDSQLGLILIFVYLFCDSFTSQWQSRIFKKSHIHQFQMQLGVNIWSLLLTGMTLIYSGEGIESISYILQDSDALMDQILLSITSAVGQLFIFYTIKGKYNV
jgi:solute carrier family 35 (adenosine 3'-phospho 5'-phosphosulfate transporter), member B2